MAIPSVDLADFLSGNHLRKAAFVQELGHAYEKIGFVAVKNHGVPEELIADLYRNVQEFFSLPSEQKKKYEIYGLAGQRGYTSFGKEHAKDSDAPDLKEFFQYGQIAGDEYPKNVTVNQITEFNPIFEREFNLLEYRMFW